MADPRRAEGKQISLPAFLWMSFLAIASGATGYRAMSRFARSNAAFFQQHFGLRHAMPSHVSFRSLWQELDKQALYEAFNQAFSSHVQPGDWVAADGQSLCSTVRQAHTADQQFVSVVSLYCQRTGLTAALQDYTDKKSGEMSVLRQLLLLLQERGVVFTLDALHGQKNSRCHCRQRQRLRAANQRQPAHAALRNAIQARHQATPAPAGAWQQVSERRSGADYTWRTSVYAGAEPHLEAAWGGWQATSSWRKRR